jgi:fermentation-respiration switch protein FrsA (DUF1100 family)
MDNGRRGTRRVVIILGIAIAVALVWVAFTTTWLWRHQERVVFQPPSVFPDAPASAQRMEFTAADGHRLFGYVIAPNAQSAKPRVVIAFHGNADLAAWTVPWATEVVKRAGVTVFIPEYRGYAGIPGIPSYATAAADARGALTFAQSRWPTADIILYGHSLGTALATELAADMRPNAPRSVILQSPFTSAREMATRMLVPTVPWLWNRISRVPYDTRALVSELDAPVHVAHGLRDLTIPVRMGRQVFAAARHRGELLLVDGAGHNDVADVGGERYWHWLAAAVRDGR